MAALYCSAGLSVAVYSLLNIRGLSWIGSLIAIGVFAGLGYLLFGRRP